MRLDYTVEMHGTFMLKVNTLKLTDGQEFHDVDIVLTDEGILMLGKDKVTSIGHNYIALIVYTDSAAVQFVKGRGFAHYLSDVDSVREILEDFDYEMKEMEDFITEAIAQNQVEEDSVETNNPYKE